MTADFCERWDSISFDPAYDTMTVEDFEPMVRRIFAREPFQNRPSTRASSLYGAFDVKP